MLFKRVSQVKLLHRLARGFSEGVQRPETSTDELAQSFTTTDGKVRIRGRPFLPGSDGEKMPRYLNGPREDFPFVVNLGHDASTKPLSQIAEIARSALRQQLPKYGVILFKGLPLKSSTDFALFNKELGLRNMTYEGGLAVRELVGNHVMTASREPPSYTIEPHNEMAYLSHWATHLAFFCDIPPRPGCGGESILVANREFQKDIDSDVKAKFERLGVLYVQYLPGETADTYLSWKEAFQTDDKSVVEQHMSRLQYTFEWKPDNALSYSSVNPVTRPHHSTGEEIWFNQAHMNASYFKANPVWAGVDVDDEKLPFNTYYGDGSEIEQEVVQHLRDVIWEHAIGCQMQKGDVLFLDNMLVQHGRLGYVGDRRLFLILVDDKL